MLTGVEEKENISGVKLDRRRLIVGLCIIQVPRHWAGRIPSVIDLMRRADTLGLRKTQIIHYPLVSFRPII
jgi:hypothetical protein